ncbi:MAG: hypothetical protein K0R55_853 [Sporomusa sp.]|nr:hypothetical protein [Sporomusa sp.]
MKNRLVVLVIILSMLMLLSWAVKHYYFPEAPAIESPSSAPAVIPPPVNVLPNEPKPAAPPVKNQVSEERAIDSLRFTADKLVITDEQPTNLSEHTMTLKRNESKGYELMPGVNVKSGGVRVQLDQENNRSIEIKRSPANSNSDYQLILHKKF